MIDFERKYAFLLYYNEGFVASIFKCSIALYTAYITTKKSNKDANMINGGLLIKSFVDSDEDDGDTLTVSPDESVGWQSM